jgi:hypothetical protein
MTDRWQARDVPPDRSSLRSKRMVEEGKPEACAG